MRFLHFILCSILGLGSLRSAADSATVYFNGDILTMSGETPNYVQSIVVKGDRITFTGKKEEALAAAGPKPILRDLKGHTLLPGFIDTWGHFALVAQNTLGVNLGYFSENPPATKAQLIGKLRREGKTFNGWLVGTGYADAVLSDGPLSLSDLDKAFPNQPVLVANISTLTGLVNSAGLKKLGITESTKAVSGFLVRDPKTGKLTGELIGMPYMEAFSRALGQYSEELTLKTYRKAESVFTSNGFTTAQSYEATPNDIRMMRLAIDKKVVALDLIALPTFDVVDQLLKTNPKYPFGSYSGGDRGFKVAGMMVPTDGAPQLRLGYFTKPFLDTTGFGEGWRGFQYYPQSLIDKCAQLAYKNNIQYFAYSNGDAGIDMTLAALEKAIQETGITEDRRPVISHSMFVREDQLAKYKKLKVMAILLVNHTWLYGDVYPKILGAERAENINPLHSAQSQGVRTAIHNDSPSSGPNALFSMWSAVNRKTFSGKTLGPKQRVDPYLALQGFTCNAAYQYREESSKGMIRAGLLADLVELDRNPLKVDPDTIKDIQVVRTFKHGKQIYAQ